MRRKKPEALKGTIYGRSRGKKRCVPDVKGTALPGGYGSRPEERLSTWDLSGKDMADPDWPCIYDRPGGAHALRPVCIYAFSHHGNAKSAAG